jgi:hypothetical protein
MFPVLKSENLTFKTKNLFLCPKKSFKMYFITLETYLLLFKIFQKFQNHVLSLILKLVLKRIQLFDLRLTISLKFYIATKTSHHLMFRFDVEMKFCVLFKLCYERKQNKTKTYKIVLNYSTYIGKKAKHSFFHERKQKLFVFINKKRNLDIPS